MKIQREFTEKRLVPIIKDFEDRLGIKFKPTTDTYKRLGINRKRLGLLVSGKAKKELKADEIVSLSDFFGVTVDKILQLNKNH